jgi:hypothetical protein
MHLVCASCQLVKRHHLPGSTSFIIKALEVRVKPAALSAGVVYLSFSALSFAVMLPLARLAPHLTAKAPLGDAMASSALPRQASQHHLK